MGKRTLVAILATTVIAGGALAISQVDSSRFTNVINTDLYNSVDLVGTVSRTQLIKALSNAANDMGYDIKFKEVYEKGYRLGSVEETSRYQLTKGNVSIRPMCGIKFYINGDTRASLDLTPLGPVSDEEIKQYLSTLSNYLSEQ